MRNKNKKIKRRKKEMSLMTKNRCLRKKNRRRKRKARIKGWMKNKILWVKVFSLINKENQQVSHNPQVQLSLKILILEICRFLEVNLLVLLEELAQEKQLSFIPFLDKLIKSRAQSAGEVLLLIFLRFHGWEVQLLEITLHSNLNIMSQSTKIF